MFYVTTEAAVYLFNHLRLLPMCRNAASFSSKISPHYNKQTRTSKSSTAKTINVWDGISISELSRLTRRPLGNIIRSINSGIVGPYRVGAKTAIENRELLTGILSLLGYKSNFINPKIPKEAEEEPEFDIYPR